MAGEYWSLIINNLDKLNENSSYTTVKFHQLLKKIETATQQEDENWP